MHKKGLAHRDIKPSNVIFVNGHPKLADVGLVSEARTGNRSRTIVGTMGYMPPHPERPGTAQADIYAFGMLLYVISTGNNPPRDGGDDSNVFPKLPSALIEPGRNREFMELNKIILRACDPEILNRYQNVSAMLVDLRGLVAAFASA